MEKTIVIIATLDTKGDEALFLKKQILKNNCNVILIDIGSYHKPKIECDIPADVVSKMGGAEIEDIRKSKDRRWIESIMVSGASKIINQIFSEGKIDGVIGIGGLSGTALAANIMAELPVSIPKLIVSTGASMPGSHRFFGPTGITLMHSMFDVGGLNTLLKSTLAKAGNAICSMARESTLDIINLKKKPLIAVSTYGYVENCAHKVYQLLSDKFEIVRFHATGQPEIAMEKLIEEGIFSGIIDLVPSSITNMLFNGSRVSWQRRLEVAAEKGIPQVISTGGINTFTLTGITEDQLTDEQKKYKYYFVDSQRVTFWLPKEEFLKVTDIYIIKLNKSQGPTKILIPMRGWNSLEREGTIYLDADMILTFTNILENKLKKDIEIRKIDANLDDNKFAEEVARAFNEVFIMWERSI